LFIYFYDKKLEEYVQNKPQVKREKRKVLIFSLSKPSDKKVDSIPYNWKPLKELLEFHKPTLEKAYILVSKEVEPNIKDFDKHVLENLGIKGKEEYSLGLDMNSENDFIPKFVEVVYKIKMNKYEYKDISVYISSGTSLATLILTLFAVNDDIQIEYKPQTSDSDITALNINKKDLLIFIKDLNKN
jgi:hypothetical protein